MLQAPHPYVRIPDFFLFVPWKVHHHNSSHSATILIVEVGKLSHGGVRTSPRLQQHPSVVSHCYFYWGCTERDAQCELPVPAVTFPLPPARVMSLLPAQPQVREAPQCSQHHLHPQAVLPEPLSPAPFVTEESGSSCWELEPESRSRETWGLLTALPLNFCRSVGKSLISPGFPHKFDRVPWDSPRKGTVQVQSLIMIVII